LFDVGHEYTRDEIHMKIGGSKQSYLPSNKGEIVAACLTKKLNPQAPQVVLCGQGKRIAAGGSSLANQNSPVHAFVKRAINRWEYHGRFKAIQSLTSGPRFEQFIAGSGRPIHDVSRVVILEPVDDGQ
jgi:hypothetical protein